MLTEWITMDKKVKMENDVSLQALRFIGNWMEQAYGDKENVGHFEEKSLFKMVLASLEQYKNQPASIPG